MLNKHEIAWLIVGENKANKTSLGVLHSCSRTELVPVCGMCL